MNVRTNMILDWRIGMYYVSIQRIDRYSFSKDMYNFKLVLNINQQTL